eukprot:scaffold130465_cov54-Phaeocystis_antarctica.AAC.1
MRGALRPAFAAFDDFWARRCGVVWCAQRGSTGRIDGRKGGRIGGSSCGSVGGSARIRGRMARALGSSPTGPSGRIARGPRVESHGALGSNRTVSTSDAIGGSHWALGSNPTGSTGD